jgi:carboxylesterase type B
VPKACLERPKLKVPVMVYVHGGGAREGYGHIDGMHDNARMCTLSVHEEMPVIVVNIGYRLNWLGFLACGDLVEEAGEGPGGEEGAFNVGLYDQRRAFQWIQKNIVGFGGDPGDVTAFGESAGSICLVYHLSSDQRLFRRAVLQSGSPFGTQGVEEKNAEYTKLLGVLGIDGKSAKERLEVLRKVDVEKLTRVESIQSLFPYFGAGTEEMFKVGKAPDYANAAQLVSERPWVEDLIVGDCQFEGYVFAGILKHVDPKKFVTHLKGVFGDGVGERLLNVYGIGPDGSMDGNLFWANVMLLVGDVFLSEPMQMLADTLAGSRYVQQASGKEEGEERRRKVYRYTLSLTNSIPGSECSYVTGHHGVDNYFQFLNLLERYPRRRDGFIAKQAMEMARRWISFASGKEPWGEYVPPAQDGAGKIAVCDDIRGWTARTREEYMRIGIDNPWGDRRYEGWATIRWVFDQVRGPQGDARIALHKVNVAHKQFLNIAAYMM